MPTARELLEQADALMRRNRASVDDDIPVLTDALPSAQGVRARFAPAPVPVAASVSVANDDVPVLTDEIEEIEAAALDPEIGEGEPSVWLDYADAEASVIGDAPDSIAKVPPVELQRREPAPEVSEFDGLDEELAAAVAAAPREDETLQPSLASPAPTAVVASAAATPAGAASLPPAIIAGGAAALLHSGTAPLPMVAPLPFAAPAAIPEPPVAAAEPPAPPASPPPTTVEDDAAQWQAMAEEVRMQVLQRIDLFTDTGLRTQLGERLQPIVDRASADLVATINQHVGELLRAYVAEAIEREIDSWRRNH